MTVPGHPVATPLRPRASGVLLHITSLPSPYGIGDLGPAAFRWIDWLCRARDTWWQMLPLGPAGAGNSPYNSFSAFAGNPALISPDTLLHDGLLTRRELREAQACPSGCVNYDRANKVKSGLIGIAWERFRNRSAFQIRFDFERFCAEQSDWLDDFACFMAIREGLDIPLSRWPNGLLMRKPQAVREARRRWADAIDRHRFAQFIFLRQLGLLRRYANDHGVKLIGDMPIYVACDSADVWARPDLFQLDPRRRLKGMAGVPPDLFSSTGQCWGNPLYDWRTAEAENYDWWTRRLRAALGQADLVRMDHFRGFAAYWQVPAGHRTARRGRWMPGPGADLFNVLRQNLGGLPIIAEDLGLITADVSALRERFHLPGMRVLQFAFGGEDSLYLPHNYVRNCVVYTGTHDNDTTAGWHQSLSAAGKARLHAYVCDARFDPARALIRAAWASVAGLAIAPLQDILALGTDARMNFPGAASGNWRWRVTEEQLRDKGTVRWLADITTTYRRGERSAGD